MGDLYCYNNDNYIPCNSAEDQVVVTRLRPPIPTSMISPARRHPRRKTLRRQRGRFPIRYGQPATFDPVYLASGVKSVQLFGRAERPPA